MIEDLSRTHGARYPGQAFLQRLGELEARLEADPDDRASQDALGVLIREASLANPLLDFDELLVIRRKGEANRSLNSHTTATIRLRDWDNDIAALSNLRGQVRVRSVYRHPDKSVMKHMQLHWSGRRIMFSGAGRNGRWAVLDIDTDGNDLRELSPSDQNDVHWFDGCYLPEDGVVLACSTAGMQGLPCENGGKPMVNIYRIHTGTGKVRQLTFEQDSDWHPRVLPDGKVMYLRWEYTDTAHYYTRYLFHMNPDGRTQMALWGSGSYFPTAFVWGRPVPGSASKILGIVSGHHAKSETGRLLLLDPAQGRKYPFRYRPTDKVWGPEKGLANIHPEILPASVTGCVQEIPGWGRDVVGNVYDGQGGGQKYTYGTPWPLSEKYFLVSMRGLSGRRWSVCLVDVFDNMTVLYSDPDYDLFEPIPLQPRATPPVIADQTIPGESSVIFCNSVYDGPGLRGIPRGDVKRLRIFAYHYGYVRSGGHESCGLEAGWDIKRVLGTVPVEPDGSFLFRAPANTPISIQPLDGDGAALAIMRSWMVAMPGEALSCVGCHESPDEAAPVVAVEAARREPSRIEPWYGPTRPFSYAGEVQPVLDRYCVGCHGAGSTDRGGQKRPSLVAGDPQNWRRDRSYLNLVAYVRRPGPESDIALFNPMEWHASTSPLVQMLRKGHHGVQLDREAWERLYTWIDLNVPHRGMWNSVRYEKRRLELAERYAGIADNPEEEFRRTLAAMEDNVRAEPVIPPTMPPRKADGLTAPDFPLSSAAAKRLQATDREMSLALGDGVSLRLVRIPAGQFVMGSESGYADEAPRAVMSVPRPFAMGVTEVTCAQYAAFDPTHDNRYLDENGKDHAVPGHIANHPDHPVIRVSWQEATAFCEWLSRTSGRNVRLPTEAEWEWAARAGTAQQFFYGDRNTDFSNWANLADASRRRAYTRFDGGSRLHVPRNYPKDYLYPLRDDRFVDHWPLLDYVKQYPPNAWGLHDMVGNVSEWTASDYRAYPYKTTPPVGTERGHGKKVARGGSWTDRPVSAGSSVRFAYAPHQRVYNVGFRVVVEDVQLAQFAHDPVAAVPRPPNCDGYVPYQIPYEMAVEGIAHPEGEFPSREMPEMALDGEPHTKWFHPTATSTWLQFALPEASRKPMVAYRICSANDCPHRDPKDWHLLGSNDDGKTWTTLDEQTGQVFEKRHQMRTFLLADADVYKTYRLCIDSPLAVKDGIQFAELVLVPQQEK